MFMHFILEIAGFIPEPISTWLDDPEASGLGKLAYCTGWVAAPLIALGAIAHI